MLNSFFKVGVETLSYLLVFFKLDKYIRSRDDIRLVFYHGIGERNSPCMKHLKDELSAEVFEAHLGYLQENYDLISLEEVIKKCNQGVGEVDKPVCSISFDDGLYSVYSEAYPILKQRQIPFTVFLNTSSVDNLTLLWLHALNYLLSNFGVQWVSTEINRMLDSNISKVPNDILSIESWFRSNFEHVLETNIIDRLLSRADLNISEIAKEQNLYLSWEQIEEMRGHGVTFYSHTHKHFPLNSLTNQRYVKDEIEISKNILMDHNINDDFISFPFGMEVDYGIHARDYAKSIGYNYIVEVGSGINSANRILLEKIISRVGLGNTGSSKASLHASIELQPILKRKLKSLLRKN